MKLSGSKMTKIRTILTKFSEVESVQALQLHLQPDHHSVCISILYKKNGLLSILLKPSEGSGASNATCVKIVIFAILRSLQVKSLL